MEIVIKVDIISKNPQGDEYKLVRAGAKFNSIRPSYIPKGTVIQPFSTTLYDPIQLDEKYYIIYIRSMFIAIAKQDCEVPMTKGNGRSYNL